MNIDRHRSSDYLAQHHERLTARLADIQKLVLAAEDALSALEDREARRAVRDRNRAAELPHLLGRST